jgi:DNA polymerase III subunit alpha
MSDFVHLHLHSDYSLLDAAQKVKTIVKRVKELGMNAVALTEHGNLFSAIHFAKEAKNAGIKPIFGCELYVAKDGRFDNTPPIKGEGHRYNHLVLLAMNHTGWHNLIKLSSLGYLEGFYYKPRIDLELLQQYNEGLIALSACIKGKVPEAAIKYGYEEARKAAQELAAIFPDRFYLELQNHGIPEEKIARDVLIELSYDLGLPLVCANDAHYTYKENAQSHDILFCLGSNTDLDDPNRQRYYGDSFYIKSPQEMAELFPDTPEALENSVKIAERCNVELGQKQYLQPVFSIPKEHPAKTENEFLRYLSLEGLKRRFPQGIPKGYSERLDFELDVIEKMGFPGYFLIVQDFVQYAKTNGIPVGPGRGSAAGSLAAYALGITNVDPIPFSLLFERFLNPERVSMPDIDIDFCFERRNEVIDYIREKYGDKSVCQIITFGQMKAKAVVRDVARVLKMSYAEGDRIAKLIPKDLDITLDKAYAESPELAELIESDPRYQELWKHALVLEGMNRHAGIHAAGVVITPGDITDYIPLYKSAKNDVTTQWDGKLLDDLGLLKMDFLGLRTLTVIDHTLKMLKTRGIELNIDDIPQDDAEVFKLFSEGRSQAVFQFESPPMREYLKKLHPNRLDDLVAMNALYRPGPMDNIPSYIARKHGAEKVEYLHPLLEPILKNTYGIIVYQEQVMQIAAQVGGLSLGEADNLRRAMGKKNIAIMNKLQEKFIAGAIQNGVSQEIATAIYELILKFAKYGFNKSHSVAYAIVAYQTAYLKAHYPAEFMAANLTSERNNSKRIVELLNELRHMNISLNPPDINRSETLFTSDGQAVTYGLIGISNVGEKACDAIVQERKANGPYKSLFDLTCRVDLKLVGKRVLENLILAGALDSLPGMRRQQFEAIENAFQYGQRVQEEKASPQVSLFGDVTASILTEPSLPELQDWNDGEKLEMEKKSIGYYLSGHPLEPFREDLELFCNDYLLNDEFSDSSIPIRTGGIVKDSKIGVDSKKRSYARFTLETLDNEITILVFRDVFDENRRYIQDNAKLFVEGKRSDRDNERQESTLFANKIIPLDELRDKMAKSVHLRLDKDHTGDTFLNQLKQLLRKYPGEAKLYFHIQTANDGEKLLLSQGIRVNTSNLLINQLRSQVGANQVWFE